MKRKKIIKPEISICENCKFRNDWCDFRLLNPDRNFVVVKCPKFNQEVKK